MSHAIRYIGFFRYALIIFLLAVIFLQRKEISELEYSVDSKSRKERTLSLLKGDINHIFSLIESGSISNSAHLIDYVERRIEQINPETVAKSPELMGLNAKLYLHKREYDKAVEILKKSGYTIGNVMTLMRVGVWKFLEGLAFNAKNPEIEYFTTAKRLLFSNEELKLLMNQQPVTEVLFADAWTDFYSNNVGEAIDKMELFVQLRGKDMLGILSLVCFELQNSTPERAVQILDRENLPDSFVVELLRGLIREKRGEYDKALEHYVSLEKEYGREYHSSITFRRAYCVYKQGDLEGSLSLLDSVKVEGYRDQINLLYSSIYLEKDPDIALEYVKSVVSDDYHEEVLYQKALIFNRKGERELAKDTYEALENYNPASPYLPRLRELLPEFGDTH